VALGRAGRGAAVLRRDVIALIGGAAVAWPLAARAQQPASLPRVGVLTIADNGATPIFDAFRKGLRDLGYIDGRTIVFEFRFAKGNFDALPGLAEQLVRLPVDVLVTDTTSAARGATRTIPIVMGIAANPVKAGLVASTARPAGNITGMTPGATELNGKRFELITQAFPSVTQVAVLMNPKASAVQSFFDAVEETAKALGKRITILAAGSPDEVSALAPTRLSGADAFMTLPDALFWNSRATILALAEAARLPAIYPEREYADDGGLIAYGPNIPDSFRRAAGYVDRILRGAKPGDLPIDEASKFDFVINLRAARRLGLSLPPDFLARADEVIE
jgi:ABC-type uncharacterized transport system substrate-binding protein